nr:hypothetical protein [Bacillus cereus]
MVDAKKSTKKSTWDIEANIPSTVKRSKYKIVPILKRFFCVWNNQNYSFDFTYISIPLMVNGKSTRLKVLALLLDKYNRNFVLLEHKLGEAKKPNARRQFDDTEQRWMQSQS